MKPGPFARAGIARTTVVRAAIAATAIALFSWLAGVQGARPVLIGGCMLAVVIGVMSSPVGWHGRWPEQPHPTRGGRSNQVWRLANLLRTLGTHADGPNRALQHRLRTLAIARLHRLGIDWNDPRATRALGADIHVALDADMFHPRLRDVEHIVTAIEHLDRTPSGGAGP